MEEQLKYPEYSVKKPKEELLDNLELTNECDSDKDFVIPKEELSTTSQDLLGSADLDKQIAKPIKIETILCKEIASLQKSHNPSEEQDRAGQLWRTINTVLSQAGTSLSANNTQTIGTPSVQKFMSCEDKNVHHTTAIKNIMEQNTAAYRLNETEQQGRQDVCSKTQIIEPQNKKAQVINSDVLYVKQSDKAPVYINDMNNQSSYSYNRASDTVQSHNALYRGKEDQPNTLKSFGQGSRSKKLKLFVCDLCQASFTKKTRLVRHLWTHTGEKPYSCNYCGKKFGRKHHLMFHTRIHTGDKPYACQHCQYKSVDKSSLEIHMRTHTGEKPFACQLCNRRFTQKHYVTVHMRIHTGEKPYYCNYCPFKSSYRCSLTIHMRTHTGEKPYSCEYCQCKFSDNSSMRNHMRTHTGESFSCNLCHLKFKQKKRLTFHLKHKHTRAR